MRGKKASSIFLNPVLRDDRSIHRYDFFDLALEGMFINVRQRLLRNTFAQCGIEELRQAHLQLRYIFGCEKQAVDTIIEKLRNATDTGGDNRRAGTHGFENDRWPRRSQRAQR